VPYSGTALNNRGANQFLPFFSYFPFPCFPSPALMGRVAKLKLQYFGHITQGSAGQLALTVLKGIMEGLRHQGRPRRQWIHDIEEWTGCEYIQLKEMSQDRAQWRRKISEWSSAVANPHRRRSTSG